MKIDEDLIDRRGRLILILTEKIVWREVIAVPNLQVQSARQFFLGVGQRKDGYLFRDDYNALALAIHHTKHESPIEIAFPVQRIVMDVGLLIIVISDPATINFLISRIDEDDNLLRSCIYLSSNLPFNVNIRALFTRDKLTVHEWYIFRVPNDHANFVFLGHGRADVDRRFQRYFAHLKHVDPHFQSTLRIAREIDKSDF